MACPSCGSGMHWECRSNPCCCSNTSVAELVDEEEDDRKHPRGYKRDSTLKDQQSTGRKRAAIAYPLDKEAPCEWKGLRSAGGGHFPIVGCTNGAQQARHHGPDKNTLNNDEGNVHRICHRCHNRWHTKNDSEYEPGNPGGYHDKITMASTEEVLASEVYWVSHTTVKAKD
jgi:hypothetical protein